MSSSSSRGMGRRGRTRNPRSGFQRQDQQLESEGVPKALIRQGRKSGQLNLSNRNLETVPDSVWQINVDAPNEGQSLSLDEVDDRWWEQTDLVKLILASNRLTNISAKINLLPALVTLDIHDNQLTELPGEIGELQNLQRINLSHNKLTSIPPELCNLTNLLFLHLEHNELKSLPNDLRNLYNLEDLDLSHNQFTELPDDIGSLKKLKALNVSDNVLVTLPWTIGAIKGVRNFDASNNKLKTLPSEVGHMSGLEQLYLRHNQLVELPELKGCVSMKEIQAGNNQLKTLSIDFLKSITNINILDLRDNKIKEIPEEIVCLQNLQRLDLTNNDISSLPYKLGTLSSLKSLVLEGNPLRSIRRDILSRGTMGLLEYLRSRIQEPTEEGDGHGTAPSSSNPSSAMGAATVVSGKTLTYNDKKADAIPIALWEPAKEKEVTSVNFSKNILTKVPENLILLSQTVIDVNLGFNKLTSLPVEMQMMTKLVTLDLRNNCLSSIPQEFSSLVNMRELTISSNRFKEIPPVIYSWPKFENLLASDNQIGHINVEGLLRLPVIATLDLQNNDIMQVPPELGKVECLKSVQLGGNPFRNPRPAVLSRGTAHLLAYLRDRIPT